MDRRAAGIAALLFGSGACSLVYQVAWLREARLVFGASTAASAAVLAIFMGGLGFGAVVLGARADGAARPLGLYARLVLLVSGSAASTPALLWLARRVYIMLGGSVALGRPGATVVRLVLSALVLGGPAFLMGGTLPAAARSVETDADRSRRRVAVLYGLNTLGAVAGAALSTFCLLEALGTRMTLWLACGVNALVGVAALAMARGRAGDGTGVRADAVRAEGPTPPGRPPVGFVLAAAGVVGFAFFLMELVWYRMLAPILGGSTYTFGLVLATALLGIGLGGSAYSVDPRTGPAGRPPGLRAFALVCALEALLIALPYALGDRVAVLALSLRGASSTGFSGSVAVWTLISCIVVLPAATISGYQFPLLVGLLGRGRSEVGRHVGLAYASNTAGAILGSLAGGFGILPLLGAPRAWCAAVVLLLLLAAVALAIAAREGPSVRSMVPQGCVMLLASLMLFARGPTAAWRHSAIGAGRAAAPASGPAGPPTSSGRPGPNGVRKWINEQRRAVRWEAEGVESSVALVQKDGLAFYINGKSDGNAVRDAPTQVMSGLVGALLHPGPTRAFVIGLGTGSTAGWLAAVPSIERVDVAEIEPAVLEVAKACSAVNHDAMSDPKVRIFLGDAREFVLATGETYDVVFSEPSNPYRAGVASLFTVEFYRAVAARLREAGLFLQWVQAYEVDARTIRTIYATLSAVFPEVETWQMKSGDLLLVASAEPVVYDVPALRRRTREEPFRSALANVWRVDCVEGFLARYVAGPSVAGRLARSEGARLNTDDRTRIEFEFARAVGRTGLFGPEELVREAFSSGGHRPPVRGGALDWERLEDEQAAFWACTAGALTRLDHLSSEQRHRAEAILSFVRGDTDAALESWGGQPMEPRGLVELSVVATSLAHAGDEAALEHIERLRAHSRADADALLAELRWRQGDHGEAARALESALVRCREDPWMWPPLLTRSLALAREVARTGREHASRMYGAVSEPFCVRLREEARMAAAVEIASELGPEERLAAFEAFEPHVPWTSGFLAARLRAYEEAGGPKALQARRDREEFLRKEPAGGPGRRDGQRPR